MGCRAARRGREDDLGAAVVVQIAARLNGAVAVAIDAAGLVASNLGRRSLVAIVARTVCDDRITTEAHRRTRRVCVSTRIGHVRTDLLHRPGVHLRDRPVAVLRHPNERRQVVDVARTVENDVPVWVRLHTRRAVVHRVKRRSGAWTRDHFLFGWAGVGIIRLSRRAKCCTFWTNLAAAGVFCSTRSVQQCCNAYRIEDQTSHIHSPYYHTGDYIPTNQFHQAFT